LLLMSRATRAAADLKEFKSHGGKLILTHGFADPAMPDKASNFACTADRDHDDNQPPAQNISTTVTTTRSSRSTSATTTTTVKSAENARIRRNATTGFDQQERVLGNPASCRRPLKERCPRAVAG